MKKIGITQRIHITRHYELRAEIDTRLYKFIYNCGYLPIPIPYFNETKKNSIKKLKSWVDEMKIGGIVLSGGDDIGKFKIRDFSENFLIKYSLKKKIPIFGICRGMQVIGKYFDTKLIKVKKHVNINHFVYTKKNKKFKVNSFHNFSLKECPKKFSIECMSEDRNIESIYSKLMKIYGCMWHPERYKKFKDFDIKNFKNLFK